MASGRVPTTTATRKGVLLPLPEHVGSFARAVALRGDKQTEVELVQSEVVGHQVVAGQGGFGVLQTGVGAGGVAGGDRLSVAVGEPDGVVQVDVDQAGYLGIG